MARYNRRTKTTRQQSQAPCKKGYIWNGTECVPAFQPASTDSCPQGYDVCNVCGGNATYDAHISYDQGAYTIDGVSGLCDCNGTEQQQDECQELYAEQFGGIIYRCPSTGEYYFGVGCMDENALNYDPNANEFFEECCDYECVDGFIVGELACGFAFDFLEADCFTGYNGLSGEEVSAACPATCGCPEPCPGSDHICMAECFSCPLPSRKGGIVKKQQGGIVNTNSRFSGRSQSNPKGNTKK